MTKEQIEKAKRWDLLSYLQTFDPHELKRSGPNEYCTRTHDSLKISCGLWCWNVVRQIVAKGNSGIKRKKREGKDSTKEETAQKEQRDSEMGGEIKLGMSNRVESVDKSRIGGYSGIMQKERKMIPMKEIQEAIMSMGGHQGRECYWLLCLAVYEAKERWPERPQMKEIWVAECLRERQREEAASKVT